MKKSVLLFMLAMTLNWHSVVAQTVGESIDVSHYEIHLWDFDFANQTLQGEAFINFTATGSANTIVLELKALTVTDVACDSYSVASFGQDGDLLSITFDEPIAAGENAMLDVRYGGSPFHESWGGVEWWGPDYAYNLGVGFDSQPHNLGKTWFPCVDTFTDKATYDVYVTTTNDKKAICGGLLADTTNNGDGTTTWHWNTPQEIATYHISFAVGDYEVWEDVYHGVERDIPIEVWAKPAQMNSVPGTFVHIKEIAAFFEENLGPYPFNRIGYVSTSKGCMEHTDNIAFAADIINGNTSGESYVAHELSHMWSGNLVTCAEAGDMWLNEGFAQFWGWFYRDAVYGSADFQGNMAAEVNKISTWCNTPGNWMPLNNMPLDMTYDSKAVYDRGAVIVNTMMNYMGRENFLAAMRQYFGQYAYQAATSEQLCEALTQHSGIDMHGFFDSYVYSSGMPHLYAVIESVTPVGNQFEVNLKLSYQHIGDNHVGQGNRYDVTFIGPGFQLVTEKVEWDGLYGNASVRIDFEPLGLANDFNNNWLDGMTQKNFMLTNTTSQNYANVNVQASSLTDSVFFGIENHLVGPYDDPLIPYLTLSTKRFWTINRYDFGDAELTAMFDYSRNTNGDIIQTENDSATLLYRKNASEPWHEAEYTLLPASTWKQGRFIVDNPQPGEYVIAAWDKEALGQTEFPSVETRLGIYPNPTEKEANIVWNGRDDGSILLCDMNGKTLKRIDFAQSESLRVDIGDLPKGCYLIKRCNRAGTTLDQGLLIVK